MSRAWGIKLASYLVFLLVMLVMTLGTLTILCLFLPFVALKALWTLVLAPLFGGRKGKEAPA